MTKKKLSENIIDCIKRNKIIELEDKFVPLKDLNKGLTQFSDFFAKNKIENIKLINCQFNSFIGMNKTKRTVSFQYSVKFNEFKFGLLIIELYTENKLLKIKTLNIIPLEKPIEKLNSFYGDKIDIVRVFIITISILLMLFLLYTEFHYYRNMTKPKIWLQVLMPLSFFIITINWNSLAITFKVFSVNLMPLSSFSSGIAGVWKYSVSIPVFLFIYWFILRKKNLKDNNEIGD